MRELARIQFQGDSRAFQQAWNARFTPEIQYGVVAIYKDDPNYQCMKQMFAMFAKEHNTTWSESVDVEYSDQELASLELLALHIMGRAGPGNNELTTVYVPEPVCQTCGRVEYRQVRDLVLDFSIEEEDRFEIGYFQHDLCRTRFGDEVVVSAKVKALLEQQRVSGIVLRPIQSFSAASVPPEPYYQMVVEAIIGPLVNPTRVQRLDRCEICGQYRQVLFDAWPGSKESEFYFCGSSYAGHWIMRTMDRFGRGPDYRSDLIVSQQLIWPVERAWHHGFLGTAGTSSVSCRRGYPNSMESWPCEAQDIFPPLLP